MKIAWRPDATNILHKFDGAPLDRTFAEARIRREPLAEVTQDPRAHL
jgi:hypothetical protein